MITGGPNDALISTVLDVEVSCLDIAIIGILVSIVVTFAGAWYGAWYRIRKSTELANKQKAVADAATRQAHLWHLQDEFAVNQRIMHAMLKQLDGGPPIVEMLEPVEVATSHLQFKAWDALVQAGVLAGLSPQDQHLFRSTHQAGRKAACDIQTISAEWRRAIARERFRGRAGSAKGAADNQPIRARRLRHERRRLIHSGLSPLHPNLFWGCGQLEEVPNVRDQQQVPARRYVSQNLPGPRADPDFRTVLRRTT